MSYLRSQYSNCHWSASGDLECDDQPPLTAEKSPNSRHLTEFTDKIDGSDKYGSLSRELAVSVYTQADPSLRIKDRTQERPTPIKRDNDAFFTNMRSPIPHTSQQMGDFSPYEVHQPQSQPQPQLQQIPMPSTDMSISSQIMWTRTSRYYEKFKKTVNKYYFQTPFQKYYELANELGQPTVLNPNKGGMASWQNPGQKNPDYRIFHRIDILDEECFNHFPYPHIGFLYTYIKIKIPISILNKVLSMSGDIMYDPLKHILTIRGMSINYNIALTVLVHQYVSGKITWYNITEYDLIRKETHYKRLTNIKNQKHNLKYLQTSKV
jgi:hypothetical protein